MRDRFETVRVLAAHPTSRGFGWVVLDGPLSPVAWGIASARPSRSSRSLARFERLLAKYAPAVFVMEDFDAPSANRAVRVRELCRAMCHLAAARGTQTQVYPKHVVQAFFGKDAPLTRHQIAEAVAAQLDHLSHRLPKKRSPWSAEDARQSLFDAAALAIVHYARTAPSAPHRHPGAPE
jgi:hypothetical protein